MSQRVGYRYPEFSLSLFLSLSLSLSLSLVPPATYLPPLGYGAACTTPWKPTLLSPLGSDVLRAAGDARLGSARLSFSLFLVRARSLRVLI